MKEKKEITKDELEKAISEFCAKKKWHYIQNPVDISGNTFEIQMEGNGIATVGIEDGKFRCTIEDVGKSLLEIIKDNREASPSEPINAPKTAIIPRQVNSASIVQRKPEIKILARPRPINELSLDEVRKFCNCPKADDGEVQYFVEVCWRRGLNIFTGDAFYVPYGSKHTIIVSKAAFLKKAELNPQYDGMDSGIIICENQTQKESQGSFYLGDPKNIVGGWAKVYRKDRKVPSYVTVSMKEFVKDSQFWKDRPGLMIEKVAQAHALRQAFPNDLAGLYQDSEMDVGGSIEI